MEISDLENKISKKVKALAPSGIRAFFELVKSTEAVISLGVGEPDFTTPWHIREAAIYSIEQGYTTYTSNQGLLQLREAISSYLKEKYQVDYEPDSEILITVGVSQALDLALRSVIDPGDEVIIIEPCYVAYKPCIQLSGGIPAIIPTYLEDGFKPSMSQIREVINNKTKAIIISYPNNPTGTSYTYKELQELAELILKHELLVISDEIYAELTYDEHQHISFSAINPKLKSQTILLKGFSKAFAMTGWRVGYVAAPEPIIGAMAKIHQYTMLCAPIMAQLAALEALRDTRQLQNMLKEYYRRRELVSSELNRIGLPHIKPSGAFYVFPNIEATTALSSEEFCHKLLKEEHVAVVPGNAFGSCGEGFCRISYANSIELLTVALQRIERFVNRYRR